MIAEEHVWGILKEKFRTRIDTDAADSRGL